MKIVSTYIQYWQKLSIWHTSISDDLATYKSLKRTKINDELSGFCWNTSQYKSMTIKKVEQKTDIIISNQKNS